MNTYKDANGVEHEMSDMDAIAIVEDKLMDEGYLFPSETPCECKTCVAGRFVLESTEKIVAAKWMESWGKKPNPPWDEAALVMAHTLDEVLNVALSAYRKEQEEKEWKPRN